MTNTEVAEGRPGDDGFRYERQEYLPSLRSRYWLTALRIRAKVLGFRDYVGRINKADVEYLQRDPNINEAIADLHALSREAKELAWKLSTNDELRCGQR